MDRRFLTYKEKNHLLDLMESCDYAMREQDLARYILLHEDEHGIVRLARYFVDFSEEDDDDA